MDVSQGSAVTSVSIPYLQYSLSATPTDSFKALKAEKDIHFTKYG